MGCDNGVRIVLASKLDSTLQSASEWHLPQPQSHPQPTMVSTHQPGLKMSPKLQKLGQWMSTKIHRSLKQDHDVQWPHKPLMTSVLQ